MSEHVSTAHSNPVEEHRTFLADIAVRRARRRRLLLPRTTAHPSDKPVKDSKGSTELTGIERFQNYSKGEETIRNDYLVEYIVSGEWNGNWLKGVSREDECKEYPKLRKLQDLKSSLCDDHAHPPLYITLDPSTESPRSLTSLLAPHVFDVVLIRPPQEYTWPEIIAMPIRLISSDPGFVFLWVGSSDTDGLERGREALLKWGFRRCEEIVWIKKNTRKGDKKRGRVGWTAGGEEDAMPQNLLVNQKEHCLVGIRGTVRRKTDNWFVHCNVDTDIIVWERDPDDPEEPDYPPQLYSIIENFCLGARRLDLFAPGHQARRGWVTVGPDEVIEGDDSVQAFDPTRYGNWLEGNKDDMGRYVLPLTQEIDNLRPKSPIRGERGGGEPYRLPNRPGHVDRTDRGRQHDQQSILSPIPMTNRRNQGMASMATTAEINTAMHDPTSMPMMNSMNPVNIMNMNNPAMKMNGSGMNFMNMNNPGMMGMPMMNMGFPMMNMGMMGMGMGMGLGMNPMMQGMFSNAQSMNSNQAQQPPQEQQRPQQKEQQQQQQQQ